MALEGSRGAWLVAVSLIGAGIFGCSSSGSDDGSGGASSTGGSSGSPGAGGAGTGGSGGSGGGSAGSPASGGSGGIPGTGGGAGSPATGGAGGAGGGSGGQGGGPTGCQILAELGGTIDDVVSVAADGTGELNLTNRAGVQHEGVWSPDGTRIAYVSNPGNDIRGDIHVMDADGSNDTPLTTTGDNARPSWSPDGTMIAFDGGAGNDIFMVPADGSASPTNLTNDAAVDQENPQWSPDGTKIAYVSDAVDTDLEIFVMDSDGQNQTNLTNDPAPPCPTCSGIDDVAPVWSPDGTMIAFKRDEGLTVMGSDGMNRNELQAGTDSETAPSWSPDSARLTFSRPEGLGRPQTWLIDADGQNATAVTADSLARIVNPQFSPDGQQIAAIRVTVAGTTGLVTFPASDGSSLTTIAMDVTGIPRWSPSCP